MAKKRRLSVKRLRAAMKKPKSPAVTLSTLAKLGSIAVHAEEMLSRGGHHFDARAIQGLLADPEVEAVIRSLTRLALVPLKRQRDRMPGGSPD